MMPTMPAAMSASRPVSEPLRQWALARARSGKGSGGVGAGCLGTVAIFGVIVPVVALIVDGGDTDWLLWAAGGWLFVLALGAYLLDAGGRLAVKKLGLSFVALLESGRVAQATVVDHQVELRDDAAPSRSFVLLVDGRTLTIKAAPGTFAGSLPRGASFEVLHDGASNLVIPTFEIPRI